MEPHLSSSNTRYQKSRQKNIFRHKAFLKGLISVHSAGVLEQVVSGAVSTDVTGAGRSGDQDGGVSLKGRVPLVRVLLRE